MIPVYRENASNQNKETAQTILNVGHIINIIDLFRNNRNLYCSTSNICNKVFCDSSEPVKKYQCLNKLLAILLKLLNEMNKKIKLIELRDSIFHQKIYRYHCFNENQQGRHYSII